MLGKLCSVPPPVWCTFDVIVSVRQNTAKASASDLLTNYPNDPEQPLMSMLEFQAVTKDTRITPMTPMSSELQSSLWKR